MKCSIHNCPHKVVGASNDEYSDMCFHCRAFAKLDRKYNQLQAENKRLKEALREQIKLWNLANRDLRIASNYTHEVNFIDFHNPVKRIDQAMGGNDESS